MDLVNQPSLATTFSKKHITQTDNEACTQDSGVALTSPGLATPRILTQLVLIVTALAPQAPDELQLS